MLTVLSLGAGVQSSTLALMAAHGEVTPMPDCAIFADTGWEPKAVYTWLDWLEKQLPFPVVRVYSKYGSIYEDQLKSQIRGKKDRGERRAALPYHLLSEDGKKGMMQRQCTAEYKIEPVNAYIRKALLGLKPRQHAPKEHVLDQWYGISFDEMQRMKLPFTEKWRRNVYPLVERQMRRYDCLNWMKEQGHPQPPRSACIGCPFHSNEEWRAVKSVPEEWRQAVHFDEVIRGSSPSMQSVPYLHRDCVPLGEVDLSTAEDHGQLSMLDECEGMCGV